MDYFIPRHKVFISYYHSDDQRYKDCLCDVLNPRYDLFDDYSVRTGDIDDEYMSDERIRIKIRDEYISDATVLILLCGKNTKKRKYVDWELHAAMYDTEKNPKMGIVVINLPESSNHFRACTAREKELVCPNATWHSLDTRDKFERNYPDMPSRIIDCLVEKNSDISVVSWARIMENPIILKELVDVAYKRRKTVEYSLVAPLCRRNS